MKHITLVVVLAALPSTASAEPIDLALHERTVGQYRGGTEQSRIEHYPAPAGGISVAHVCGRVTLPSAGLEPGPEAAEGTFVLLHDALGAAVEGRAVRVEGLDLRSRSAGLPSGGALLFGSLMDATLDSHAALAAVDGDGAVRWSWRAIQTAPRSCDPSSEHCVFAHLEAATTRDDRAWVVGDFRRGTLELPGGHVVRGPRYLNTVLLEVDLSDGRVRWARLVRATAEAGLVLAGDRLALASSEGPRSALSFHACDGGRPLGRAPLPVTGAARALVGHDDGFAVLFEGDPAWTLVGVDARGAGRFQRSVARYTTIASDGRSLHVASPIREEHRFRAPLEGIRVVGLDSRGHELGPAAVDGGTWARETIVLGRGRQGGVILGGVLVEGSSPRLVVRRPGAGGPAAPAPPSAAPPEPVSPPVVWPSSAALF